MARAIRKITDDIKEQSNTSVETKVKKKVNPPKSTSNINNSNNNINTEKTYKDLTITELRKLYEKTVLENKKLEDSVYCHHCGKHLSRDKFYKSNDTKSGLVPMCRACLFRIATNYNDKTKETNETVESIKEALKICNRPFKKELYDVAFKVINDETKTKQVKYIWSQIMSMISSLPQYSYLTWKDSDDEYLEDDENDTPKVTKKMKEFWGDKFPERDIIFLDKEYKDWVARNEVNTKPMEEIIKRLCFKQLEIYKATLSNSNTKDLDGTFQALLDSANLKPKQLNIDALSSDRTFGQLIDLWERDRPIPEPEPEFKDIDNIGRYISVFFLGHLAKMIGIENRYSKMYDDEMSKYTVYKPEYEEDTELLFEVMFGKKKEE